METTNYNNGANYAADYYNNKNNNMSATTPAPTQNMPAQITPIVVPERKGLFGRCAEKIKNNPKTTATIGGGIALATVATIGYKIWKKKKNKQQETTVEQQQPKQEAPAPQPAAPANPPAEKKEEPKAEKK